MDEIVAWFIKVEVKAIIPGVELSTRYQWAVGHYGVIMKALYTMSFVSFFSTLPIKLKRENM